MPQILILAVLLIAAASPSPSPSLSPAPAPSPSASPADRPGFHLSADVYANFINTAASGPGVTPPEANGFINGSPLAPNTPYDVWTSAPLTSGIAGITQLNLTAVYTGPRYEASAVVGAGLVTGSMQNALYWGENLMPTLNAHVGYTALPYSIAFPTHAGQDDASATAISPLFASFGARDDSWNVRGGFFNLNQTDKFVFVQPPLTNVTPSIGLQTAESLGNGAQALTSWPNAVPVLPLHGVELTAHRGIASLELTNAALPALPGDSARASIASLVFDHGEGTRYSFSYLHVATSGIPILTTTFYGANPQLTAPGPQGTLPTSTLAGQVETIAGARASFHIGRVADSVVEIGRTWYDAADVFLPGTSKPGGFYHLGFSRKLDRVTLGIDGYRFEARYANMILPYGIPENIWSAAWAWPGVWLKSNFQLVENTQAPGSNRQGYRVRYALDGGPLEIHAAFSVFHQIDPATFANMQQAGFVDGFFLPQQNGFGTLGVTHQYNAWIAWHPAFADITLDYANDELHRDAAPAHPEDAVAYQTPQTVLTFSRAIGKTVVADIGFGRYAMKGTWAQPFTNVDYFQNTFFAGGQFAESRNWTTLVQIRHAQFVGLASIPGAPSSNFNATTLVFEQRVHL